MKCLVQDCERESSCRGLCHSCYQTASRNIKTGRVTWKQLIIMGLAIDARTGTGHKGAFMRSLEEAEKNLQEKKSNDLQN